MGAPKKADWREERRKRAWALKEQGWRQKDIAAASSERGLSSGVVNPFMTALEVSEGAVSQGT